MIRRERVCARRRSGRFLLPVLGLVLLIAAAVHVATSTRIDGVQGKDVDVLGCGVWQSFKEMLGISTPLDPIFRKQLDDEISRLRDPSKAMEQMMQAQQPGNAEMLAKQEAERMEELTFFHKDNLARIFNKYDKNKDGFLDVDELLTILDVWSARAVYWIPVILLRTTIETVNIAKENAKAQNKPIPASAKRNFRLAKKQIADFSRNFFRYSNPVVVTRELAERLIIHMLAREAEELPNNSEAITEGRQQNAGEVQPSPEDEQTLVENKDSQADTQSENTPATNGSDANEPTKPLLVSKKLFQDEFLNAMHVERIDSEGIIVKLHMFVAQGIRAASEPTGPTLSPPSQE